MTSDTAEEEEEEEEEKGQGRKKEESSFKDTSPKCYRSREEVTAAESALEESVVPRLNS